MSCGKPHEVDCSTVLDRIYEVLDNEADDATCAMVLAHLQECPPCDQQVGVERKLKELVARACGCETVPDDVRRRVELSIEQVRVQVRSGDQVMSVDIETTRWTD